MGMVRVLLPHNRLISLAPALRYTNASMHVIIGTSLMIIALVGSGGVISALADGVQLPMPATAMFALATAMGMLLGRRLLTHVSECQIQRGFSLTLLVVATGLLVKAYG